MDTLTKLQWYALAYFRLFASHRKASSVKEQRFSQL
jgi:hypothetical protein